MKEINCDNIRRERTLIKALEIITLALLVLVSVAGAAPYAYVANSNDNNVSVIDTATNTVTSTVNNLASYPADATVSPDGKKIYVVNKGSDMVSAIDTSTNKVSAKVYVGEKPGKVAVSPDSKKIYVANEYDSTVSVIDAATNIVIATVNVGGYPRGVAVSSDGKKVYVANYNSDSVSVIDATTNTITATVNVGNTPEDVAASPVGTKIYVVNAGSGSVSVIDTSTDKVTYTIPVGSWPKNIAVSSDGKKIYVTNSGDNNVYCIDTTTNTFVDCMVGSHPLGVAVTSDGKKVYVANSYDDTVSVIDTATNTVTNTIPVGKDPEGVAVTPLKPVPLVANFTSNVTSGNAPLSVAFTDKSSGTPTKWKWTFGDGTNSTLKNPTHKYSKAGNYTVALTATNAAGSSTKTKTNYIKVKSVIKPIANFTSNVTSGNAPLNVAFTDKSSETPTAWKWTFGDGTNSTTKNPTHKYSKAGNYTVALTATNVAGSSTKTKTNYIKVKSVIKPIANFTSNVTSGKTPLTVSFTDKSTNSPISWKWTFGDGTNSTIQNPTHKYSKSGNYTVALTATNAAGSNTATKANYIKVK